jgi:hypothetical protein
MGERWNRMKRPGRAGVWIAVGIAALVSMGAGIALGTGLSQHTDPPGFGPSQTDTLARTSFVFTPHYYYFLFIPCDAATNCTGTENYDNAIVTVTFASANTSKLDLIYFYGDGVSGSVPSGPHAMTSTGSTVKTVTFVGWFTEIHNPHPWSVTGSFSWAANFEIHGN